MRGFLFAAAALGAALMGTAAIAEAPVAAPMTASDVETWMDGFMPYALKRGAVAGAVVAVVKDGQVLFEKGYGYSDVAAGKPVDPKETLFRPGSTSKLFTWTAVMQQVEQGKLDLDADVNTYLDFKIPPRDGKPITLRNIMTHTAGFEESIKGLIHHNRSELKPLGDVVKAWTPERIFDAGTTPAYSNYATALAGYIVERVSGEPFPTYMENHVFAPLQMAHSSFAQPLPEKLEAGMSKGYATMGTEPKPYEFVPLAPAGSLASTGDDMTRFMIAHLQNGRFGNTQILKPETAKLMHDSALDVIPHLNRMELGFYENNINGHRVIGHAGDTQLFHTYLWIYPDDNVGVVISMNSAGREGAAHAVRQELFEMFSDRYLPGDNPDGKVDDATAKEHAKLISGYYENSRRAQSSFVYALNLIMPTKVYPNADGTISVSGVMTTGGEPKHYREIEPFHWREINGGHGYLGAVVVDGKVTRFSIGEISPFMLWEHYPAGDSPAWLQPSAGCAVGALLLTVICWPIAALIRRGRGLGPRPRTYHLVRIADLLALIVLGAWGGVIVWLLGSGLEKAMHVDAWLYLMEGVSLVALLGGFLVSLANIKVLWSGQFGWFSKTWCIVQSASLAVLLWAAWAYHLIGFNTQF
jgi:CubicO group peptidase (beta-lactamase class C family)